MNKSLITFACLVTTIILTNMSLAASSEDDLAKLTAEIELLKEENTLLRKENIELRKEIKELKERVNTDPDAKMERSKDEVVGAAWEISFTDKAGKRFGPFKFLAQNGQIFAESTEERRNIGTYTETGAKVRIDVTNCDNKAANGVYSLIQIKRDPPTYSGSLTNTQGNKFKVDLRILVD